ncbi:MAG: hypothetical protein COV80_04060 [Parcubacteria group bacterium CG11_big_fil_rev_8_21_14_0_20_48_46]|nr:MAG: hypothetical protein COZ99_00110 [Parcubacteria group bacterium CG_4_8_14_3_um_filter_48_16]PIY77838.1 MAG: hypothetical protein COY83_03110 [Parcubacteria group bacterium CG_4_10_14_0_8_um_filter_48_154]PIZ78132.1 MAG: hypothetical protein COY03_00210 [bacterium CG_4_10_14_0_2_um_filter_48_144]PJC39631.1 MAG: hypothetical protein CO043_03245 [Parcubacteria group bacterium CG_4_9_14_0_2_um_filter_48_40]PJE52463.1 MAG: hypothetical protein COV80_04060 [Parcubacteria group bacterium CG11_
MRDQDIIKELKKLQSIRPSAGWKKTQREVMLMQVRNTCAPAARQGIFAYVRRAAYAVRDAISAVVPMPFGSHPLLRQATLGVLVATLALSGGFFGVQASRESLPGDPLYQIKRAMEYTQLTLAGTQEDLVALEIEFAGRRLDELTELIALDLAEADRYAKISAVTGDFSKSVGEAKSRLQTLDASQTGTEALKNAEDKISSYEATLQDTSKKIAGDAEVRKTVDQAVGAASDLNAEALSILVAKYYAGEADIPETELKVRIAKRIVLMEERVKILAETQRTARETLAADAPESTATSTIDVADGYEASTTPALLAENPEKGGEAGALVGATLEAAKTLNQESDFAKALEKISESSQMVTEEGIVQGDTDEAASTPEAVRETTTEKPVQ